LQVQVYGISHSPWVQAVLLGLHHGQIEHSLTTLPPLEAFIEDGVAMPAASIDGGRWQYESADILQNLGYDEVTEEEMQHIQSSWRGVLHRADSIGYFWGGFSLAGDRDENPFLRLIKNFFRSSIC